MRLHRPGGVSVIVKNQTHARPAVANFGRRNNLIAQQANLVHGLRLFAVGAQKPGVQLFLRHGGLPPAEKADGFCTMRKGFPAPETHHAGQRHGIIRGPVHRAGLLLHDPPAPFADSPVQIVVKGLKIRVALPRIRLFPLRIRPHPILEEAHRVAVPTCNLQIITNFVVIKVGDPAHIIMRNWRRRMRLDDINLPLVETHHLVGTEPAKGKRMGRVGFGHGQVGQANLIK